jgi:transcriptional regulator with XRE-family HTH domain
VGERIRRLRSSAGSSQEALAHKIKVTPQHIANIESGAQRLHLGTAWLIADALGVKITELLPDSYRKRLKIPEVTYGRNG